MTSDDESSSGMALATYYGCTSNTDPITKSITWGGSAGELIAIAAVFSYETGTTTLYRSVGNATGALASGGSNALTISGSTATFGSDLGTDIGVGDAIQYDSDDPDSLIDAIAFIHGRTDAKTYTVKAKDGTTPTAATGDNDWAIYRAYDSLSNWESLDENDLLHANMEEFNDNSDLTAATGNNTIMMVACYIDTGPMDDSLTIDGWTTGPDNYIKIYTPTATSEVGTSQRHTGKAGTGFVLQPDDNTVGTWDILRINEEYVRIEGIEFDGSNVSNKTRMYGLRTGFTETNPSDFRIDKVIVHDLNNSSTAGSWVAGISMTNGRLTNAIVYNISDISSGSSWPKGIHMNNSDASIEIYNTVVYNVSTINSGIITRGIHLQNGTATVKNTYVGNTNGGSSNPDFGIDGGVTKTLDYIMSSDTSASGCDTTCYPSYTATDDATPDTDSDWIVFTNLSSGSEDFHLLYSSQNGALNNGSLPSVGFSDDIDGDSRPQGSGWDIGADELVNDGSWFGSCWQYRKKLTLDAGLVSADLTDFPVSIAFTNDSELAAAAQSDFDDVLFTSADGITKLAHEIEDFDGTNGDIVAWVKIPSLSSSSDTDIYMYYGCGTVSDQQNAYDVWTNGFRAVYHLNQSSGGSGAIKNSVSDNYHGTDVNSPTFEATGRIGPAIDFDYSQSEYIDVSGVESYDEDNTVTVTAWVKATDNPWNLDDRIYAEASSSDNEPLFTLGNGNND
jgi:hypothetical protein